MTAQPLFEMTQGQLRYLFDEDEEPLLFTVEETNILYHHLRARQPMLPWAYQLWVPLPPGSLALPGPLALLLLRFLDNHLA